MSHYGELMHLSLSIACSELCGSNELVRIDEIDRIYLVFHMYTTQANYKNIFPWRRETTSRNKSEQLIARPTCTMLTADQGKFLDNGKHLASNLFIEEV